MYQVKKKDGRIVDFDLEKIVLGITKAGGTLAEARVIASDIESWLPGVAVDNVVDAVDIREKVVKELKVLSIKVAANFESYQKS